MLIRVTENPGASVIQFLPVSLLLV